MPNGKIDRKALPDPRASTANVAELANVDVYDLPENQPATDHEKIISETPRKNQRQFQLL